MACGILARADRGGIATQSLEMARHVSPAEDSGHRFGSERQRPV